MAEWTTSFNWPGTCFPDELARRGWTKQVREAAATATASGSFPGILTNGNWSNPNNAKSEDGATYASVDITPGAFIAPFTGRGQFQGGTDWLVVTDFGFAIPAGSTIQAVSFAIKFTQSVTPLLSAGGASIYDFAIVKAGNPFTFCDTNFDDAKHGGGLFEDFRPLNGGEFASVGYDLGTGAPVPAIWTAIAWQVGGADTFVTPWLHPQLVDPGTGIDATFTAAEVNASSFGAAIALGLDPFLSNEDGTAVTFNVDAFQVAVYYIGAAEEPQIFITT